MTDAQTALFGVTCDLCDVLAALATAATEGESPLENELHAAEALIDRVFAQCRRETRHVVGAAEVLRNLHGLLAALDTAIINQAIGTPTPAAANANAFPNVGDEGFICLFVCCLFFGCFFFFVAFSRILRCLRGNGDARFRQCRRASPFHSVSFLYVAYLCVVY